MGWRVPGLTSRAEMRSRVSSEQLEWGGMRVAVAKPC